MNRTVWVLLVAGCVASAASAQTAIGQAASGARADSATIAALERRIENALVKRDAPLLDSAYAPSFRFKHSTGTLETREQRMANVRSPMPADAPGRFIARDVDSLEVEVHGNMALTTGRIHVVRDGGDPRWRDYTVRYVRLYARNAAGRWQLVTHHSTSDSQGPPPTP
ncbi:MAG TPA: nuclear transport factor 2 family protein [Gemmatimonadaceae bacterium]|nr:nuclear transport factor 2 family protein [Gemmatimonadaceae bacterium]